MSKRLTILSLLIVCDCSDFAKIGALCPAGCTKQASDPVCVCDAAQAGRGGSDAVVMRTQDAAVSGDAAAHSSADGGAPDACHAGSSSADRPGNLVVALDATASLVPWWPALSDGFRRFILEDASRGLGVGLLNFDDVCDTESYLSALVPIAPLPDNLPALQANIPSAASATTSTIPVLTAALQYTKDWLSTHPNERAAVLLLTDASPGVCDGLNGMADMEIARLASDGFHNTPSIPTYAIGGDSLPNIGPLATAGGTQAVMIKPLSTSDDVLAALRKLRSDVSSSGCTAPP